MDEEYWAAYRKRARERAVWQFFLILGPVFILGGIWSLLSPIEYPASDIRGSIVYRLVTAILLIAVGVGGMCFRRGGSPPNGESSRRYSATPAPAIAPSLAAIPSTVMASRMASEPAQSASPKLLTARSERDTVAGGPVAQR